MLKALDGKVAVLRQRRDELDAQLHALLEAREELASLRPKRKGKPARTGPLPSAVLAKSLGLPKPDGQSA